MTPEQQEKFWSRVVKQGSGTGCWLWTGTLDKNGYGFYAHKPAHRVAWEIAHGTSPGSGYVCHSCDVRRCVNPDHLWLGSARENFKDMLAKGRAPSNVWRQIKKSAKRKKDTEGFAAARQNERAARQRERIEKRTVREGHQELDREFSMRLFRE